MQRRAGRTSYRAVSIKLRPSNYLEPLLYRKIRQICGGPSFGNVLYENEQQTEETT